MEETGRQRGQTMTGHERRAPGQHGVNDTLVGLGLAAVGRDRVVRWNDKGEAMGWDVLDDLEEAGLW